MLSMSYIIELCKSIEYISVSLVRSYCIMYFSMKLPRQISMAYLYHWFGLGKYVWLS